MDLLRVPTRLGLPLLGGSELCAYISSQPGLLDKIVPFRLLLTKEPGLVSATSNNVLKKGPESEDTKNMCRKKKTSEKIKRIPG